MYKRVVQTWSKVVRNWDSTALGQPLHRYPSGCQITVARTFVCKPTDVLAFFASKRRYSQKYGTVDSKDQYSDKVDAEGSDEKDSLKANDDEFSSLESLDDEFSSDEDLDNDHVKPQTTPTAQVVEYQNKLAQKEIDDFLKEGPENEKYYKVIQMEVEVLRQERGRVPETLTPEHWLSLIKETSHRRRVNYLAYLWKTDLKEQGKQKRKEIRRQTLQMKFANIREMEANAEPGTMLYGFQHNHLFLRVYKQTMQQFYNNRLISALQFNQKLVYDFDYCDYMNQQEISSCARQICTSITENRIHQYPFAMYFCNAPSNNPVIQKLMRLIPQVLDDDFPIPIHAESYLDIFDKKDLVYLTPHTKNTMTEVNPDAIYIIGAFVDKSSKERVSFIRAKKEGIRMEALPLDKYLKWGQGSGKNLTMNQVTTILLDANYTRRWDCSLQHVPTRKLEGAASYRMEKRIEHAKKTLVEQMKDQNFCFTHKARRKRIQDENK